MSTPSDPDPIRPPRTSESTHAGTDQPSFGSGVWDPAPARATGNAATTIELPAHGSTSTHSERGFVLVPEPEPEPSPAVERTASEAPPPAPTPRPTPPPSVRPPAQEVEAVRVTRFDAPAPTIDVAGQRVPPASPSSDAESRATSGAAPPDGSGTSTGAETARSAGSSGATAAVAPDAAARFWAAFCHLFYFLAPLTLFLSLGITVLVWQLAGRHAPFVDEHGREALNFQITVALFSALLALVPCLGWLLLPVAWIAAAVFCVFGAVRAAHGESWRYPWILRVVRT